MSKSFSFGAQFGDEKSHDCVGNHYRQLKELITNQLSSGYTDPEIEFAPVLRVDGDIWHWGIQGVHKVRRSFKEFYITADIGIARSDYLDRTPFEIRSVLVERTREVFTAFLSRLKRDSVIVDEPRLLRDVDVALERFLASDT